MSDYLQPTDPTMGRNRDIAHDLENLPSELIESVIKEATLERVIRLSSWAGPKLTQALRISPAWRHLFGAEEDRTMWQKCLRLTDNLNVLCFDTRRDGRPFFKIRNQAGCIHFTRTFCQCDKDVSFLQTQDSRWLKDAATLRGRWLRALGAHLDSEQPLLKLPLLEGLEAYLPADDQPVFKKLSNFDRPKLSVGDLETGVVLYQRALVVRRKTLAEEFRRLASLYEAHPQLLKVPFAPQTSKPSVHHVPQQFRSRARKLERTIPSLCAGGACRTYFHEKFLALVPYDWTLRFFVAIMEENLFPIDDKCQIVLNGIARYYPRELEHSSRASNARTAGTPWSLPHLSKTRTRFMAGTGRPTQGGEGPFTAHPDVELNWLEMFVEVVASLMVTFPDAAAAAQAADKGASVESNDLPEQLVQKMQLV